MSHESPRATRKTFHCAICGKPVGYAGPTPELYPFCSERCKMVDLGRWFNEQYTIDRDLGPEDLPDEQLRSPSSS